MKLCMSPYWVSSLLERSCLAPAVSFLLNNPNEGFAQTYQAVCIRWNIAYFKYSSVHALYQIWFWFKVNLKPECKFFGAITTQRILEVQDHVLVPAEIFVQLWSCVQLCSSLHSSSTEQLSALLDLYWLQLLSLWSWRENWTQKRQGKYAQSFDVN